MPASIRTQVWENLQDPTQQCHSTCFILLGSGVVMSSGWMAALGDSVWTVNPVWALSLANSGPHCPPPGGAGTWASHPMASLATGQLLSAGKSGGLNDPSLGTANDSPLQMVAQAITGLSLQDQPYRVKRGKWLRIRWSVSGPGNSPSVWWYHTSVWCQTHAIASLGLKYNTRELAHLWISSLGVNFLKLHIPRYNPNSTE